MASNNHMKTLDDFEGWEETITELFREGKLESEVRSHMRMTRGEWDHFQSVSAEFARTVELGLEDCEAKWSRAPAEGKLPGSEKFDRHSWALVMKNAFGWSDRITQDVRQKVSGLSSLTDEQLDAKLAALREDTGLRTH